MSAIQVQHIGSHGKPQGRNYTYQHDGPIGLRDLVMTPNGPAIVRELGSNHSGPLAKAFKINRGVVIVEEKEWEEWLGLIEEARETLRSAFHLMDAIEGYTEAGQHAAAAALSAIDALEAAERRYREKEELA